MEWYALCFCCTIYQLVILLYSFIHLMTSEVSTRPLGWVGVSQWILVAFFGPNMMGHGLGEHDVCLYIYNMCVWIHVCICIYKCIYVYIYIFTFMNMHGIWKLWKTFWVRNNETNCWFLTSQDAEQLWNLDTNFVIQCFGCLFGLSTWNFDSWRPKHDSLQHGFPDVDMSLGGLEF